MSSLRTGCSRFLRNERNPTDREEDVQTKKRLADVVPEQFWRDVCQKALVCRRRGRGNDNMLCEWPYAAVVQRLPQECDRSTDGMERLALRQSITRHLPP